ncbi:hypothetical protein MRX96_056572 [Rhipicephalus microplus]
MTGVTSRPPCKKHGASSMDPPSEEIKSRQVSTAVVAAALSVTMCVSMLLGVFTSVISYYEHASGTGINQALSTEPPLSNLNDTGHQTSDARTAYRGFCGGCQQDHES